MAEQQIPPPADPRNIARQRLRAMTRSSYDLQKLRIQAGLRLCANFRAKMGQVAGEKEEDLDDDAKKVIDLLRASFVRLTDGIARNRTLPSREGFKGDELITDYTELVLISQYLELERVERQQFSYLEGVLSEFPIYTQFLSPIRGIGPAMGAVIISEIDIGKARYVSSLWSYAGLDTVTKWALRDVRCEQVSAGAPKPDVQFETAPVAILKDVDGGNGPVTIGDEVRSVSYLSREESDRTLYEGVDGATGRVGTLRVRKDGWVMAADYAEISLGGRSRRKEHLVKRKYIDKKGKEQERDSITYNPFLKTKLMGVLAGSFLRSGSPYREHYDSYKHRLQSDPRKADWSKGHVNDAAKRYMIKQFLAVLFVNWRTLEGFPVPAPYSEAKLGTVHRPDRPIEGSGGAAEPHASGDDEAMRDAAE